MHNRDNIKWAPFNSVINGNNIVNSIIKEKNKINKPILSEEQINEFEELIRISYINKVELLINIYKNGYIKKIKGTVIKIDTSKKQIILDNHITIYFCEIVKIKIIEY